MPCHLFTNGHLNMELTKEQIDRFVEINKGLPGFEKYSQTEIWEIANGVANYYLTLVSIYTELSSLEEQE